MLRLVPDAQFLSTDSLCPRRFVLEPPASTTDALSLSLVGRKWMSQILESVEWKPLLVNPLPFAVMPNTSSNKKNGL